jgi:hypothetical protein
MPHEKRNGIIQEIGATAGVSEGSLTHDLITAQ